MPAALRLDESARAHLASLGRTLDAAWRGLAARLAEARQGGGSPQVRLEPDADGRIRIRVSPLEAVPEPPSLVALRDLTARMLPRVDLPELLLLEVDAWTGFTSEFTHLAESGTRMEDLPVSAYAVLVAEACNIGFTPVVKPGVPALTRDRLSHVEQNYVRADTISAANARLIGHQAGIGLAQLWGGGLIASADGLRFVAPVQTLNAGMNPKYFGTKHHGLTWLNAINDQVPGIGAVVVPGTMRDSLYILDLLPNLDAGPKPDLVATDTASYSDIVFGLFRLLGYQFSPRIADLSDQRFWRLDVPGVPPGDYGPLNALARHKVTTTRIASHWADMQRVAASLAMGTVRACDLLRMLGRDGSPTPLGQALADYGKSAKTLHLLAMCDPDESYRRTVHVQLNTQESRHRLARKIFHGQRGELRQRSREGQEDQLGTLGLVLNAVVLWNTKLPPEPGCQPLHVLLAVETRNLEPGFRRSELGGQRPQGGAVGALGVALLGAGQRGEAGRFLTAVGGRYVHGRSISDLAGFLEAVRRHGWDDTLPASAAIYPEDCPPRGARLPRGLAA